MNRYILFAIFLLLGIVKVSGQCNYESLLKEGHDFFIDTLYTQALNKYNAARTCNPLESSKIDDKINEVFEAIEKQRKTAEDNRQKAVDNYNIAIDNERIANAAKDSLKIALTITNSLKNLAIKQKDTTLKLRYQAEALNNAFLSERENERDLKRHLALRAYVLNKKYNDNKWNSSVISALLKSEPEYHSKTIKELQSNLIDMVRSDTLLYFISEDSSGIYNINTSNIESKHSYPNLHYLRNSLMVEPNTTKFIFKDQKYGEYKFDPSIQKISKTPSDSIIRHQLRNGEIEILGNQITFNNSNLNSYQVDLPGNLIQTITASKVSPKEKYLGIGTQDGRLYIYELDSLTFLENMKGLQFHNPGSLISDVAFDPEEELIVTTGYDGMLKIIKISEIKNQKPIELNHDEWLRSITFLDQNYLVVGTKSGKLIKYVIDPLILVQNICNRLYKNKEKEKEKWENDEIDPLIDENCKY